MSIKNVFGRLKGSKRAANILIVALAAAVTVLADQISKLIVVSNMQEHESIALIDNVLRITYITNRGSAFGMLAERRWVFMVLSLVGISAMLFFAIYYADKNSRLVTCCIGMIAGGGIGNMIDRVFNGEAFGDGRVIDFIDFCLFPELWKWIFNIADAFVCVGCGILAVTLIVDEIRRIKADRAVKENKEKEDREKNEV